MVVPSVSKIFERMIEMKIDNFINNFLSQYSCACSKGFVQKSVLIIKVSLESKYGPLRNLTHYKPWITYC